MIKAAILGASGYSGGELIRILLDHPHVDLTQITSRGNAGAYAYQVHPNLRRRTELKFIDPIQLERSDVLFLALPHGEAQRDIGRWASLADHLVDLSADFRLADPEDYQQWYGETHTAPEWLGKFVYGLPEINRNEIAGAQHIAGVGCNAAASILALLPLHQSGLIEPTERILIEIKVGSSEAGAEGNIGSTHAERSGVVRTFSAFGHRHTAEVMQAFGLQEVALTMTAVDLVRGALATAHVKLPSGRTQKDLWAAYRQVAAENPFIRIVKERRGIYRVPEPKILAGSNYADIGFEFDEQSGYIVSICAIDNLMKGAAGSAVQSMNLMLGLDETLGLDFPGLHPI